MTLSEILMLLVAAGTLIIEVVKITFDITWKISHDRKDDDNKKSK